MQNTTCIYACAFKIPSNVMIPLFLLMIFNIVFLREWLYFLLGENVLSDQEAPVGVLKIIFTPL